MPFDLAGFQTLNNLDYLFTGTERVNVQDRLAHRFFQLNAPNPHRRRIAIGNPILIIDKDNTLFHGGEDGF